nr:hypothetical protein GCM10020241_16210 [Streptoalloteichus tenebrarius]
MAALGQPVADPVAPPAPIVAVTPAAQVFVDRAGVVGRVGEHPGLGRVRMRLDRV